MKIKTLQDQLSLVQRETDYLNDKSTEQDIRYTTLKNKLLETKEAYKTQVQKLEFEIRALARSNEKMKEEIQNFKLLAEKHKQDKAENQNKYNELEGKLASTQRVKENLDKTLQPWLKESQLKCVVRQDSTKMERFVNTYLRGEIRKKNEQIKNLEKDLEDVKALMSRPAPTRKDLEIEWLEMTVKKQNGIIRALNKVLNAKKESEV